MNAEVHFTSILEEANAVILAVGTLQPVKFFPSSWNQVSVIYLPSTELLRKDTFVPPEKAKAFDFSY